MYSKQYKTAKVSANNSDTPAPSQLAPRRVVVQPQFQPTRQNLDAQAQSARVEQSGQGINPNIFKYHPPIQPRGIQMKLSIGEPGDKYEQEADKVAADVVQRINAPESQEVQRMDVPEEEELQMKPAVASIQRMDVPEEEELQMKPAVASIQRQEAIGGGEASTDLDTAINSARGSGQQIADNIRQPMEQAFGADFSGVKVHTDAQSDQLNRSIQARAFTTGQDLFFRKGEYNPGSRGGQELLAHELTHVVQQTGTIQPCIQRYHTKHKNFRTSDDGQIGVAQENSVGGQTAYATPALIKDASDKLKAATSVIELKPGSLSRKLKDLDGKKHNVVDVVPINTKNNTEHLDMELWADCGRSAKTVSGMDKGTGQGNANPGAKYNKDGKTKIVTGTDWMNIQKVKMFMDLFNKKSSWWEVWKPTYENKLDIASINKKLIEYETTKKNWAVEKDTKERDNLAQRMAQLAREMDVLARSEYEKLSPDAKNDFDKKAGINMYADPNIGEAFHISTGGNEHPDKPADVGTWNFHWAGVVMKSGSDTMTLENYSVSDYEEQNTDWVFQMYGVGKKGQSFHEEHKDVHKQHGNAPTSMVAVSRKSQEE
jgi:hypothetical protein